METEIHPKPKRTVTFTVDENEARNIAGYLEIAIDAQFYHPFATDGVRKVMHAFAAIRDGR